MSQTLPPLSELNTQYLADRKTISPIFLIEFLKHEDNCPLKLPQDLAKFQIYLVITHLKVTGHEESPTTWQFFLRALFPALHFYINQTQDYNYFTMA